MIEISATQFAQNPAYIQSLAEKEPVILDNGKQKQVLINYDDFVNLNQQKPFVSAYDAYMHIMSDFSPEKLDALANDSVEFDMSFARNA